MKEVDFKKTLGDIGKGKKGIGTTLGHVTYYMIDKTPYSFHFYAVYVKKEKEVLTEFLYDLRNRKYFIKRNGRELVFNVTNLDTVLPRPRYDYGKGYKPFGENGYNKFMNMVSVPENEGMYHEMVRFIGSLGLETVDMTSRALIRLIKEYNKLEILYKYGLNITTLGKVLDNVVEAGKQNITKPHQILGLTKAQLKFFKEYGEGRATASGNDIKNLSFVTQQDMDLYKFLHEHVMHLEEKYDTVGRFDTFIAVEDFHEFVTGFGTYRRTGDTPRWGSAFYKFILDTKHSNPKRLIEYLLFECYLSQGLDYRGALSYYKDYYQMCKDLEYTNFDKYPKYLKTSHDIVMMNYKLVSDKIQEGKFADRVKEYTSLTYQLKNYVIRVPEETKDLVVEGNVLHHCVASYVRNVAEGRSRIIFLREKNKQDDPLVTVEVKGDKIVQARGHSNRNIDSKERDFLYKFANAKGLEVAGHV